MLDKKRRRSAFALRSLTTMLSPLTTCIAAPDPLVASKIAVKAEESHWKRKSVIQLHFDGVKSQFLFSQGSVCRQLLLTEYCANLSID